jgi:hypothetical protein
MLKLHDTFCEPEGLQFYCWREELCHDFGAAAFKHD